MLNKNQLPILEKTKAYNLDVYDAHKPIKKYHSFCCNPHLIIKISYSY